jgi:hypothetical protein
VTNSTLSSSTDSAAALPATDVTDSSHLGRLIEEDPLIRILDVGTGREFDSTNIRGFDNVSLNSWAMGDARAKFQYNKGRGCDVDAVLTEMRKDV